MYVIIHDGGMSYGQDSAGFACRANDGGGERARGNNNNYNIIRDTSGNFEPGKSIT